MKVMLLCYDDEAAWEQLGEGALQRAMQEAVALTHELHAKGQYRLASPLQPVATASTVRVRDGKRLITDGPFAETREQLGGFYLIEARDLNEAIQVASRIPSARIGSIEIRPVVNFEDDPAGGTPSHAARPAEA